MDYISEIVLDFHKKQDKLTKEQFQDCLMEAIASGDFVRHCTKLESSYHEGIENTMHGGGVINISQKQAMTYIPYREVLTLKGRVIELEEALKNTQHAYDLLKETE